MKSWDVQSNVVKEIDQIIKLTGTGAAQPTQTFGLGMSVNRTGVGVIEISWQELPGQYVGLKGHGFEATTIAALKGYTVVAGAFDPATAKVVINITNATDTLADLAANQHITLTFAFNKTSLGNQS